MPDGVPSTANGTHLKEEVKAEKKQPKKAKRVHWKLPVDTNDSERDSNALSTVTNSPSHQLRREQESSPPDSKAKKETQIAEDPTRNHSPQSNTQPPPSPSPSPPHTSPSPSKINFSNSLLFDLD